MILQHHSNQSRLFLSTHAFGQVFITVWPYNKVLFACPLLLSTRHIRHLLAVLRSTLEPTHARTTVTTCRRQPTSVINPFALRSYLEMILEHPA